MGQEGPRVSEFFYYESKSKMKKNGVGGGGGRGGGWSKLFLFIFFSINPGARVSDFFYKESKSIYIYIYKNCFGLGVGMDKVSDFLSSPLAGKRDIVVRILVWCMCMRLCIRICPD